MESEVLDARRRAVQAFTSSRFLTLDMVMQLIERCRRLAALTSVDGTTRMTLTPMDAVALVNDEDVISPFISHGRVLASPLLCLIAACAGHRGVYGDAIKTRELLLACFDCYDLSCTGQVSLGECTCVLQCSLLGLRYPQKSALSKFLSTVLRLRTTSDSISRSTFDHYVATAEPLDKLERSVDALTQQRTTSLAAKCHVTVRYLMPHRKTPSRELTLL
eukprot:PhM_4_TR16620/c0_g2_i1/m.9100